MSGDWCREVERKTRIIGPDTLVFAGGGGGESLVGEESEPAAASVIEFRASPSSPEYNHFFIFSLSLPPPRSFLLFCAAGRAS